MADSRGRFLHGGVHDRESLAIGVSNARVQPGECIGAGIDRDDSKAVREHDAGVASFAAGEVDGCLRCGALTLEKIESFGAGGTRGLVLDGIEVGRPISLVVAGQRCSRGRIWRVSVHEHARVARADSPYAVDRTMNLLHVLNPWFADERCLPKAGGSDAATVLAREAMRALGGVRHETLVIGGSDQTRRATDLGVTPDARVAPPLRSRTLARRALRRHVDRKGSIDAVVGWDVETRALCGRGWKLPVLDVGLSRAASAGEGLPLPVFQVDGREEVRAALGVGETEFVLGLLADPPSRGDATRLIFLLSMLHLIGVPVVGVMNAGSRGVQRAMSGVRLAYSLRPPVVTEMSVASFLPGCDAAVLSLGSRFGGDADAALESERVLAGLALQAGVPVLTWDLSVIPEALREVCTTRSGHPGHVSKELLRLAEDRAHLERASEACRRHAPGDTEAFAEYLRARLGQSIEAGAGA